MQGLVIIAAWLYLHAGLLAWFGRTFSHTDFRLNAFLLFAALAVLAWRLREAPRTEFELVPRMNGPALILASALGVLGFISRRVLDVQMIEAPLFILGSWALLGLFTSRAAWRRALVPALVFVAVLPFGAQADAYAGFMARVLSAKVAAHLLASLGASSISAETVLVFENGVAQIDAPCSGLRSLWMGGVVFLVALWIEARRLDLRALGALGLLVVFLVGANVFRVALIVYLAVVLQLPLLAEIVHVPVGLVGFLIACAGPLLLLRRSAPAERRPSRRASAPALGALSTSSIAAAFVALGAFASTRPAIAAAPDVLQLELDPSWRTTPIALSAAEQDLLGRFAGGRVSKRRLERDALSAALLLVESSSWRTHHPPELCLAGAGHHLSEVSERLIQPGFSVRFARLDDGRQLHVSWFQSGELTHADLMDRIIAGLLGERRPFVMVSVVLAGFEGPEDPDFFSFLTMLRAQIARSQPEPTS